MTDRNEEEEMKTDLDPEDGGSKTEPGTDDDGRQD